MDRRAVLSGLLASLSGCVALGSPSTERTEANDKRMNQFGSIAVAESSGLAGTDAKLTACTSQQATSDGPALLRIAVENRGEDPLEVIGGPSPPLTSTSTRGSEMGNFLYLISKDEVGVAFDGQIIPENPTDTCWVMNGELSTYQMANGATIPAGGELSREYAVLAGPGSCLETDGYVLTNSLSANGSETTLSITVEVTA